MTHNIAVTIEHQKGTCCCDHPWLLLDPLHDHGLLVNKFLCSTKWVLKCLNLLLVSGAKNPNKSCGSSNSSMN